MEIAGDSLPFNVFVVLVVRAVLDFFFFRHQVELVVNVFVARLLLAFRHVFTKKFTLLNYLPRSFVLLLAVWALKPGHDRVEASVSV